MRAFWERTPVEAGAAAPRVRGFTAYAWGVLGYNLLVIMWGAYVRASGSGNGCGDNWPLCDGQFLPHVSKLKMLIEFLHRVSSGVDAVLVLGLLAAALWLYPRGHRVRRGAKLAVFFIVTEALLGAALVLFGWVGQNASAARVAADALHLVNTLFLLAVVLLTAAWASGLPDVAWKCQGRKAWLLGIAVAGVLATGVCGVMAALADTLFPSQTLAAGLRQDFSSSTRVLERLRVIHPAVALVVGLYLIYLVVDALPRPRSAAARRLGYALVAAVLLQWTGGVLDVTLLAPVGMQMIHLLTADLLWLVLVLYVAAQLSRSTADTPTANGEIAPSQAAFSV